MSKTIIKSNTGGVGPLPLITTPLSHEMPITSVTLDTKGLKDVSVLLTFTSQINLTAGVNTNLVFVVKKYVDKGSEQIIGGSYVFSTVAEVLEAETFAFQFYDNNIDPGKYTYAVQLAPNSFVGLAAGVTVTNATLSLLATGEENHH